MFLGPSLPHADARALLDADYRAPIRRGDLAGLGRGQLVGIVDGVFDQSLSVSPSELREAVARGVRILGSSSMGALRAAEVREVEGVGRIFEQFRSGELEDDDEVAIVFDPDSLRALSEPMVNIRYAVSQLARPGTLDAAVARRILQAAKRMPYRERSYRAVLTAAGVYDKHDGPQLHRMLAAHDLKRQDAVTLLERLKQLAAESEGTTVAAAIHAGESDIVSQHTDDGLFLWEYGDRVSWEQLVLFLKMTGVFQDAARKTGRRRTRTPGIDGGPEEAAQLTERIHALRIDWSWISGEEAKLTMQELGVTAEELEGMVVRSTERDLALMALARRDDRALSRDVRLQLLCDDLALKRAVARAGSILRLAQAARARGHRVTEAERARAQQRICEHLDVSSWRVALVQLAWWGVPPSSAEGFVEQLALARHAGEPASRSPSPSGGKVPRSWKRLGFRARRKPRGEKRFTVSLAVASRHARRLRKVVGITRVGVTTGLDVVGLPNANAFRPDGMWSSTVGAGKSESVAGARVGAIMEEVEKWAQERYLPPQRGAAHRRASFAELSRNAAALDPATLDLPYDSCYRPELVLDWTRCADLLAGRDVWVPSASLCCDRLPDDIQYCARLARKEFSTSGLASGFSLEEAAVHALCETIERHHMVMASLALANPGVGGPHPYRFVDLRSVPASTRRIVGKLERAGRVRLMCITSEIDVPTFEARVLVDGLEPETTRFGASLSAAVGSGAHPDPEVAANMALLEASQTILTNIQGAREDLSLHARSLGRHQRTGCQTRDGRLVWLREPTSSVAFDRIPGVRYRDARDELAWLVARVADAGVTHVAFVDLGRPEILPARVVRVLVPGLETPTSVRTGPRGRALLLRELW